MPQRVDATVETADVVVPGTPLIIYSLQSPNNRAGKSSTTDEALVYHVPNYEAEPYATYVNLIPTSGALFPGAMLADNMGLTYGFVPGVTPITSYDLLVARSSSDPLPDPVDFHVELWDGDPFCMYDTPGNGFSCQPIPGTAADFIDVPANAQFSARAILPANVTAPNDRVWMVLSGSQSGINPSPCRFGWDIAFGPADVGNNSPDDIWLIQKDSSGVGTCCGIGAAGCNVGLGTTCSGDEDGSKGLCTDGDAEEPIANFINPVSSICQQNAGERCSNLVASIRSPALGSISLVPIGNEVNGNLDPGVRIDGNHIILPDDETRVVLEVHIGNWDPQNQGTLLHAFQTLIDSAGYSSGLQGFITPALVQCSNDADCKAAFSGRCDRTSSVPGAFCQADADCSPGFPGATPECTGSDCSLTSGAVNYCQPGFVLDGREDFVFAENDHLAQIDLSSLDYRYNAANRDFEDIQPPTPFPAGGLYAGTLVLDVPANAAGTFTVAFKPPPFSVLQDDQDNFLPLIALVPAKITVGTGRCCYDLDSGPQCVADITATDCALLRAPNHFTLGQTCNDFGSGCAQDCNANGVVDPLDIVNGTSTDMDADGIPDECQPDCNDNGQADYLDISGGASNDCQPNGIPDECELDCNDNDTPDDCEIAANPGADLDNNGVPDDCECPPATPLPESPIVAKNRYLSITPGNQGQQAALRVTLFDLPVPFDAWNGISMWVGAPSDVSLLGGLNDDTPPTFRAASLQCQPYFTDWHDHGTVHVSHEAIIPGATYHVQAVDQTCDLGDESTYSSTLVLSTSLWGDVSGYFDGAEWAPPDNSVTVVSDALAVLDAFMNAPSAPMKPRADLAPQTPDRIISISDITKVLFAFSGWTYPFPPGPTPCATE